MTSTQRQKIEALKGRIELLRNACNRVESLIVQAESSKLKKKETDELIKQAEEAIKE